MKFYLCELKINGCKNLNKTVDLRFSNKTIKNPISFENSNIKAIYGPNGAGKSAIMTAMYIYKRLICDSDGLNDKGFSSFINESINKELGKMEIEVTFIFYNKVTKKYGETIRHLITLCNKNGNVTIEKEQLLLLKGRQISDEYFKKLISTENGKLCFLEGSKNVTNDVIYSETNNLLDKHSILIAATKFKFKQSKDLTNNILLIIFSRLFAANLFVHMEQEDLHEEYILDKLFLERLDNTSFSLSEEDFDIKNNDESNFYVSFNYNDFVDINLYDNYEKIIYRLENFLKIFKPDLKKIEIEKKINNDKYICKKIMHYGTSSIDIEFESTGIKKLVRLFNALIACTNGKIVFIDEFDANLHDVYFAKLIEFMKDYSNGQLCFTTHNLEPINILKSNSHSLDFLSNDSRLTSWKKDGNKSPLNKYINGLIEFSPFNVSSVDFIKPLMDDEE